MKDLRRKEREVLTMLSEGVPDLLVCRKVGILREELATILTRIASLAENASTRPELAVTYERALRKRAENAVRSLEGRFHALLDASPNAVLVINGTTGIIRQVNERASAMFGYSAGDLVGKSMEELVPAKFRSIHPAYRIGFLNNVRKREMGYHPPIVAIRRDGSEIEMAIALTASEADDEVMVVCTEFRQWTAQKASADRAQVV
ncbi:MAG: PAS domain S-box protein [Fimbriimonas sp.]